MVVDLTLSSLSNLIRWHDEVNTAGNEPGYSGWPAVVSLSHCALDALHNALLEIAFLPIEPALWFLPHSMPKSVFTCLGRQIPGLFTRGLETRLATLYLVQPTCQSGCPGFGRCTCYSFGEPQVRVECQVGTKAGWAS